MTRKKLVFLFIVVMVFSFTTSIFASVPTTPTTQTQKTSALKDLSLLSGMTGFELTKSLTKAEAVVIYLRLLGKDSEVQKSTYKNPFKDVPTWASKYIAYANSKGYVSGTSKTTFGSNNSVTPEQYLSFLMKALEYSDKANGDFTSKTVLQNAEKLGIIPVAKYKAGAKSLKRGDCVDILYKTLSANIKGSTITLAESLITSGAIKKDVASKYGFKLQSARVKLIKQSDGNSIINFKDLIKAVPDARYVTIWARPATLTDYTNAYNYYEYKNIIKPDKDAKALKQLTNNSDVVNRYVSGSKKMAIALYDEDANMVAGSLYVAADAIAKGYIDLTIKFVNGEKLISQMGSDIIYFDTGIYAELNGPPGDSAMVYVAKAELPAELHKAVYFSVVSTNLTKNEFRLFLSDENTTKANMTNASKIGFDAGGTKFTGGDFVVSVILYDSNGKAIGYSFVSPERNVTNDPHFIYYRISYSGPYQQPDGSNRPYTVKKYVNGIEDTSFQQYLNSPYGSYGEPGKDMTISYTTAILFENSSVRYEVMPLDPSLNMRIEKKVFTNMHDYIGK